MEKGKTKNLIANCFEPNAASIMMRWVGENGGYLSELSKKSGISYAYCVMVINALEQRKFVDTKKEGRKRIVTPTKIGLEFYRKVMDMGATCGWFNGKRP